MAGRGLRPGPPRRRALTRRADGGGRGSLREPRAGAPGRGRALWALALLAAAGLLAYGDFLGADRAPLAEDYGRIFLPPLFEQAAALRQGELSAWNSLSYGGTPYVAPPNTPGLYPPLLALLWLRGAVGGLNLALLLHVLLGTAGMLLLARRVTGSDFAGLFAGSLFLFGQVTRLGLYRVSVEALGLGWLPWALLALVAALEGPRRLAPAVLAAAALAAVAWSASYTALLYGPLTFGLVALGSALRPWRPRALGRAAVVVAGVGAGAVVLAAGQLLPAVEWVALTDRAEGLPYESTLKQTLDAKDLLVWLRREGPVAVLLAVAGVALGPARGRRWATAFALAAAGGVLLASGVLQPFLYEWVPGFDRVREPSRAWCAVQLALPVCAALGAAEVLRWVHGRAGKGWAAALGVALLAGQWLPALAGGSYQEQPFAARPEFHSLSERLEANAIHRELAARRAVESPFRIHDFARTRARLKQTASAVTAALGLETLEGVLGNIELLAYDRDYLMPSRRQPARLWGMLNCRYVTSARELHVEGLEPVGTFPEDPHEILEDTDGPHLYRNTEELPRAFLASQAALLVDAAPDAWRDTVRHVIWDPRTTVLVDGAGERAAAVADRCVALLAFGGEVHPAARRAARELGRPVHDLATGDGARATLAALRADPRPLRPVERLEPRTDGLRVVLPEGADAPWLVVAHTYALYPGWSAEVDGAAASLLRANGAATAVPLPAGAREVVFRYRTPGLGTGLAVTFAALCAAAALLAAGLRR